LVGALLVSATGSPLPAVPALAIGLGFVFARWRGRPLHEWAPILARWSALRWWSGTRWTARVPLLGTDGTSRPAVLPPFLGDLEILEGANGWARRLRLANVGIVHDRRQRAYTGVLRVRGREFALLETGEQDRLLAGWGNVLGGFCRERGPIARVAWSEWAAPAALEEHLRYVAEHATAPTDSPPRVAYRDVLEAAGPMTTHHETLVAITLDATRVRTPRRPGETLDERYLDALLEELRLTTSRLEDAGLVVDPPLTGAELAEVLRLRLDPTCEPRLRTRARSGPFHGVAANNLGPLVVDLEFAHARIDQSWHRVYWIAEWPRLDMPAEWMSRLLLHGGGTRSVTVVYEPVTPSRSQRQVDRDATKLASDEEQRAKRGFRIGARHRRAQHAVLEREQELVAGYAELEYAGFLTVTAPNLEDLERTCGEHEQAAAQAGLELRALDGQHDLGVGAGLPIGRYPTARRFA
jgi:hypothetical protein